MRVHAALCASQSCDNPAARLRTETEDGGECGTEGKAQPEIVINLPGSAAFVCGAAQFLSVLSLGGAENLSASRLAAETRPKLFFPF